jgi:hypothetical protein
VDKPISTLKLGRSPAFLLDSGRDGAMRLGDRDKDTGGVVKADLVDLRIVRPSIPEILFQSLPRVRTDGLQFRSGQLIEFVTLSMTCYAREAHAGFVMAVLA